MTEGRGELGSDAALPEGPYAVGLTHTPQGDSPPWTVTAADQRAIAGHVPSKAKDRLERFVCREVCRYHRMSLADGQAIFLGDWRAEMWRVGR